MDEYRIREIEKLREKSRRRMLPKDRCEIVDFSAGTFFLFRCFLAFALLISGIVFPTINETALPRCLKDIPEVVSENYTFEDVTAFFNVTLKR